MLGFVSLTLEIAYTRVISFKLFYYYTYFVIGLALLGLGTGSAVVALSRRLRALDTTRLIMWLAPTAGAIGLLGYAVVARLATNTHLIWLGSAGVAVRQVARLLAMSLSLTAVFFVVGVLLAKLIVAEAHDVRRLYFWDLTGAALACLLAVPLQATIGPPAMIVGSTGLLAVLGVVAASGSGDRRTRRTGVAWTAVGAVAVVIGAVVTGGLEVRADETKTLRGDADVEAGDWGAVFRVDATKGFGDNYVLHHDGLWGSAIWRYDGTPATTDRFATDNRQIPFAATANEEPHVLIIGAAGGTRDPSVADVRRRADRRRRAQSRDRVAPARHVRRLRRQHHRAPRRQLRAGRRSHLPGPQRRDLRHRVVRRARQLRRVERRHRWRVRHVGELPLHARDDRGGLRPPLPRRRDRRPVR